MIEVFSHSEAGGHAENEDAFEVRRHPIGNGDYLCVVADGQGGRAGGGPAAQLACMQTIQLAQSYPPEKLQKPSVWSDLLRAVDDTVARDPAAGFTTLAALYVTSNSVCGASSGDSAVVLTALGTCRQILTERQHKNPPVGSGEAVFIPFSASLVAPWTLLAMSDGVWKYATWESVFEAAALEDGRGIISFVRKRAALAKTGQLQDDFTLVVLRSMFS
jgi:hypothetical protein